MNGGRKDVIITAMDPILVSKPCGFFSAAKKDEGLRHSFFFYYYF